MAKKNMTGHRKSEMVMDPHCDPCFKDGTFSRVIGYCPTCIEFYCQGCLNTHRRLSATERHKILRGSDMPTSQSEKPVRYEVCDSHSGELKNNYCSVHGIIVCRKCSAGEHGSCGVKSVLDACKSYDLGTEEERFKNDINQLLNYIKEAKVSVEKNLNDLDKQKDALLKDANDVYDRVINGINKSYQEFKAKVKVTHEDQKDILFNNKATASELLSEIQDVVKNLQQQSDGPDEVKRFLMLHRQSDSIFHSLGRIESHDLAKVGLKCNFNFDMRPLSETNYKFAEISRHLSKYECDTNFPTIYFPFRGYSQDSADHPMVDSADEAEEDLTVDYPVSKPKASKTLKPKSIPIKDEVAVTMTSLTATKLDDINAKTSGDVRDCCITSFDITANGNLILLDNNNLNVKLVSPAGRLLSVAKLLGKGKDVAIIKETEVAVSMPGKQIHVFDVKDPNRLYLKRSIELEYFVWGMTAYKNNLIITCHTTPLKPRYVQMINQKGEILWTVIKDPEGRRLFRYPRFLSIRPAADGDQIIITDQYKMNITVLQAKTGCLIKVCDVKGKTPQGVAVDDSGNVYVSYWSDEISVWDGELQEERSLISDSKDIKSPFAMVYNSKKKELLVTSSSYKSQYCNFVHHYYVTKK